jgi:HEAT repeat protein
MESETLDDIFARTLSGDYDDDAPWQAVRTLHNIGTRAVLDSAAQWCRSENPLKRARGADVLAQLGVSADHPKNNFSEESFIIVEELVRGEKDPLPLMSAIYALGHIGNPLAIPLILEHQTSSTPNIRFAVAFALGSYANSPEAIEGLLSLTEDADEDVRDWATFGLGVLGESDSPEIRDALVSRLHDSDEDVREEAMVGLGKRKDPRVLPALLSALEQPDVPDRAVEAASEMLDVMNEGEDWKGSDYAGALRARFSS